MTTVLKTIDINVYIKTFALSWIFYAASATVSTANKTKILKDYWLCLLSVALTALKDRYLKDIYCSTFKNLNH